MSWHPSASLDSLKQRARLLHYIRTFFASREVWEVETPLLCSETATDPHLASFAMTHRGQRRFLQTSPEFAMKRLLASGSGSIYQLGKAFRVDEQGRFHNPEFSLLEWYRVDFCLAQLIEETQALVMGAADLFKRPPPPVRHCSYAELFEQVLGINPHRLDTESLRRLVLAHRDTEVSELDRDDCLNLLMSHVIEPAMPSGLLFVSAFPASQASLAQRRVDDATGETVAARVELYFDELELANGYQELTDAEEQQHRFEQDLRQRAATGAETVPRPANLLDALAHGLPPCAGIALGVDRLLMKLLGKAQLSEVLSFGFDRA